MHALIQETAPLTQTISYRSPMLDPVRYEVRCEAPPRLNGSEVADWSLRQLGEEPFRKRLGHYYAKQNLRTVYAPTVNFFSGAVLNQDRFVREVPLASNVLLRRPIDPCDGNAVEQHAGFSMSAAGCVCVVLTFRTPQGEGICLAAHAGRNSLIDMRYVLEKKKTRAYFSVIDALVAVGRRRGGDPSNMVLRSFFSIPWEAYPHSAEDPEYGESNNTLLGFLEWKYGDSMIMPGPNDEEHLCLNALIAEQARLAGVGTIETDGCSLPYDGPFAYTTHSDPALAGLTRNLVTVIHR